MINISREVLTQLINLPDKMGVYLLKDKDEKVIFINMAKSLSKQVRAHFHSKKPQDLVIKSKTRSIEVHEMENEINAVKLELELIRTYHPPLNQRGNDQKKYRFIELTIEDNYPSATLRKLINETKPILTIGPFPKKSTIRQLFGFAVNYFEIADCKQKIVTGKINKTVLTCLRRKTKQCCRPCEIAIDSDIYSHKISNFIKFFEGGYPRIIEELEAKMKGFVEKLEFEKAALIRDNITAIKQHIQFDSP